MEVSARIGDNKCLLKISVGAPMILISELDRACQIRLRKYTPYQPEFWLKYVSVKEA